MNTVKGLLILWIIFGFIFIQAVDSILFFINHLIYFGTVYFGISFSTLKVLLPAMSILIYLISIIIIISRVTIKSGVNGVLLTQIPESRSFALLILATGLNPVANKLSGLFAEWVVLNLNPNSTEFLQLYSWFYLGIDISRWASIIALTLIYFYKYRLEIRKN